MVALQSTNARQKHNLPRWNAREHGQQAVMQAPPNGSPGCLPGSKGRISPVVQPDEQPEQDQKASPRAAFWPSRIKRKDINKDSMVLRAVLPEFLPKDAALTPQLCKIERESPIGTPGLKK
ncbi:MAG: hypothetical protein VKP63_00400, partial [Cyanobacteriota bacterium]|nr:hypothetical protein [Cyanobacteriota bacterium]